MGSQYYCKNKQRRSEVQNQSVLNGIDYLEVSEDQTTLRVYFIHNIHPSHSPVPGDITSLNYFVGKLVIEGGVRIKNIRVVSAEIDDDNILKVTVDVPGDFSTYTLRLISSPGDLDPPGGFDPQLSEVEFSFKVQCPSDFDCRQEMVNAVEYVPSPSINYLAKDYATFRQLMLDRLSVVMPGWQERNVADIGITLVEALAYGADYLSYYQDAVGNNEAYLGTARKRVSVRRHARLLDYRMHDGCNARTWIVLEIKTGEPVMIPEKTKLLTRVPGLGTTIDPNSDDYRQALARKPVVFETVYGITASSSRNEIHFYTWSDENCCLPKGATKATLNGPLNLSPGEVLVFEEMMNPETNSGTGGDPAHRHAVRLIKAESKVDPLNGQEIVEIEWHEQDGMPFPLCIKDVLIDEDLQPVSVARGNVVLAHHGLTIDAETLPALPEDPYPHERYRPELSQQNITNYDEYTDYDEITKQWQPAFISLVQNPRHALPAVEVDAGSEKWKPKRDLLGSGRFDTVFVVETDNDGRAQLRFGEDGIYGKKPTQQMDVTYRVGNGLEGNVAADAIAHIALVTEESKISEVRNPLPASGGTDPESIDQVRLDAPRAFRTQERAVTEEDYARVTERHYDVQRAIGTRRWTGSWHTMFVTVDRTGGRVVDAEFEVELRRHLDIYRLAGQDVEIDNPVSVALNIAFTVCVEPGYYRSNVKQALLQAFGNTDLPDGQRGFFHPDNFTFGQPVYLSRVVATAMAIPGIRWVDFDEESPAGHRFHRWGVVPGEEIRKGLIKTGRLEIVRLDNDPNAPENGKIEFYMKGGL